MICGIEREVFKSFG